jgi:hypothetical protein
LLLFQKRFHDGLRSGAITLTFRAWDKPHVKAGGRYRCHPIGVLAVSSAAQVRVDAIGERDARRAGFESRAELLEFVGSFVGHSLRGNERLWRVELAHAGDGDRADIALDDELGAADVAAIATTLERLDSKRRWTSATLDLIARRPHVAASKLAAELGRETKPFKADVVKLKKLGLTQSFEVGYEISPRGKAFRRLRARR